MLEMLHSPFSSEKNWHRLYIAETLYEYFVARKYDDKELGRDFVDLHHREALLIALDSNNEFLDFWNMIQEEYPEKKDYFSSLTNEDEPYDSEWIEWQYYEYLRENAFAELTEEEERTLQKEFDESRESAYQAALEVEATRLNCDIGDVNPTSPVLPWEPAHDEESMLANLPNQLFGRVLRLLEALDIFRMTFVCKRWKRLIDDNAMELKRAEHSLTTHLIRFTDWMQSTETPLGLNVSDQHELYSWCLMRWFCGRSDNLETLILDYPVPYTFLADLLQSCPNLRHLRVGSDNDLNDSPPDVIPTQVRLCKLETFMSSPGYPYDGFSKPYRVLYWDILVSSPSLRVFAGALDSDDLFVINARNPVSNVFSKLIVLELQYFDVSTLKVLAQIDNLQLRYLGLNHFAFDSITDWMSFEEQSRNALHQLLPKLNKLEMLRASSSTGVTNETIQLMTKSDGIIFPPMEIDPLQPEVLDDFRSMLLLKNPDIDLSNIQFVLKKGETAEALEAMNTGFTIFKMEENGNAPAAINELYDPKIKQLFGIDYYTPGGI